MNTWTGIREFESEKGDSYFFSLNGVIGLWNSVILFLITTLQNLEVQKELEAKQVI